MQKLAPAHQSHSDNGAQSSLDAHGGGANIARMDHIEGPTPKTYGFY